MQGFSFTAHIFKEEEAYVAYVPALDLSSCGSTETEARKNIQDAVRGFLDASAGQGNLEQVLEESGYRRQGGEWVPPQFVSLDEVSVNFA